MNGLDLIVPSPADDLCDRHLILIFIDNNEEEQEETHSDIQGLDESIDDFKDALLPNTLLQSMALNEQYKIIKIANYALSIKSEYFRNLLSKKSAFAEARSDNFVVIKVERCYAFSMGLLLRLLHINQSEMDKYLQHCENYQTLLQLLLLTDRYRIKHVSNVIMDRLKFIALRQRPKQKQKIDNKSEKKIIHISAEYDSQFDNGGMSLFEVSSLLLLDNDFLFLSKVQKISEMALCQRYKVLKFDEFGIVDLEFRKLPSRAVNIILKNNEFTSYSENDVFLAATQWAAYPLHTEDKYTMNPYDNKQQSVHKRFAQIAANLRFHFIDEWYIDSIITHYEPILFNTQCLIKLLKNATKNNLLSGGRHRHHLRNENQNNQRYKHILRYFDAQTTKRPIPASNKKKQKNKMSLLPLQEITNSNAEWQTIRNENLSLIQFREYDAFRVVFYKKDLCDLSVGHRKTSSYMVWHGVVFALDLVRKKGANSSSSNESDADSVGVFLYCQGLECCDHIWIKYALKTVNYDHALQCSDYKMMQLNFQKGNGSRDFFGCSWNTFLQTYFDSNNVITFNLQFIDAK